MFMHYRKKVIKYNPQKKRFLIQMVENFYTKKNVKSYVLPMSRETH